ncbi:MAG: hypothetical protein AUK44_07455 [Porphyromonadaceae bacterium CG2_30_38_12]|nr:MAG: hypothetical protein AUK44_07455 [Porphyromonadaceae bacterium CG2_30_38_12]
MAVGTNLTHKLSELSFTFSIARRYLFSKKSHNAINVISGISATGVAIGTLALVVVLSVFNGFESLVTDMFSNFDPDLRISLVQGKSFENNTAQFEQVKKLAGIAVYTEVIEENALIRFKDKQLPATIKGVSENFATLTNINSILYDGKFELYDGAFERAVVGIGVASKVGLGAHFIDPLYIYAPKRGNKINLLRPENSFNQSACFVSGIFSVQQAQYDDNYVLISLKHARELFDYKANTVTAIEIKLINQKDKETSKNQISNILGTNYKVLDSYEQQASFFNIMKIEKWITFLILCFILMIASFNIIGSLSMLIIDKKSDIQTLKSLGANNQLIKRIFLFEGWMISALGAGIGIIIGTTLSLLQEKLGILKLGTGYIVDSYPVATNMSDILYILLAVLGMGFFAALYPVKYIRTK